MNNADFQTLDNPRPDFHMQKKKKPSLVCSWLQKLILIFDIYAGSYYRLTYTRGR